MESEAKKSKMNWLSKFQQIVQILGGLTPFITLICGLVSEHIENKVNLSYIGKSDKGYFFESEETFPDAYFLMQGQIVIKSKDNVMIKTFIIDDMFEKKVRATEKKRFEVISCECSLADAWMEKLCLELGRQLPYYGHSLDEIVIEKIGLACVWVQSKNCKSWYPVYYILEGESLTKVDIKTAKEKMWGVKITDDLLKEEGKDTADIIIDETVEAVNKKLG